MQHRGEHTRNGRPDKARTRRVSAAAPHLFFFLFLSASALLPQEDAAAQHRKVSAAFYNVENLFDTISSPFRNDSDFTPSGRYRWDAERYRTKLSRIARTIDDAGFDIVALAEVESERAVRDLTATLADDYNFIHRTTSDRRGIDIALLYKGDKFFPSEVSQIPSGTSREFLFVRGDLIGHETGLLSPPLEIQRQILPYRCGRPARGCGRFAPVQGRMRTASDHGRFQRRAARTGIPESLRPRAERSIRRREVPQRAP